MSGAAILCLALAAVYGVTSLVLSLVAVVAWRAARSGQDLTSRAFLALRLLPSAGALLVTLTIVLPAFLIHEPLQETEEVGPLLVVLAAFALTMLALGVRRGWRACAAAQALLESCSPTGRLGAAPKPAVEVVDVAAPIVAAVGGWRPRILVARSVVAALSPAEIRQVIAHEAAHLATRDNVKLLLLVASPDVLGWTPIAGALLARWRAAAEFEADERATGRDRHKRLALAAALVKVARLSTGTRRLLPTLSMPIALDDALDDVEGRVRRLLAIPPRAAPNNSLKTIIAVALLVPALSLPFYGVVHRLVEALVAFGR